MVAARRKAISRYCSKYLRRRDHAGCTTCRTVLTYPLRYQAMCRLRYSVFASRVILKGREDDEVLVGGIRGVIYMPWPRGPIDQLCCLKDVSPSAERSEDGASGRYTALLCGERCQNHCSNHSGFLTGADT